MKKVLIAITALFYLAVSSGVVFNMHYCMGKLSGVEVGIAPEEAASCKCGSGKKAMDCCKTEVKLAKVEQDQQHSPAQLFEFAPHEALLGTFTHILLSAPLVEQETATALCNGPPNPEDKPIYLRNNVFRI